MAGLTIYTADYEPRQVYSTADADGRGQSTADAAERALVEQVVRFGDEPLGLFVEFDAPGGRVVWSFKGKRGSPTNRTEYFIAAFATENPNLFRAFAGALRALPADTWFVPTTGELRWDLGFDLWRLPSTPEGLDTETCEQVASRLRARGESSSEPPLVFGMTGYWSALAALRMLQTEDIQCRVGIGTDGDPDGVGDLDLLLVPDADAEFTPYSHGVEDPVDRSASQRLDSGTRRPSTDRVGDEVPPIQTLVKPAVILGTAALVYVAGYRTLIRGNANVVAILLGSVAGLGVGFGVIGGLRSQKDRPRLAGTLLGAIGLAGLGSGGVAMGHTVGVLTAGTFSTITAGIYMSALLVVSAYLAYNYL